MMLPLIPIFMGLLNMVASRIEPMDFSGIKDQRREMFFPLENINTDPNYFTELKALTEQHRQINFDDGSNQPRDWNGKESRFEPDIDGVSFDDLGESFEASHSIDELDENDLNRLSNFLIKLLRQPTWEAPLLIIGNPTFSEESKEPDLKTSGELENRSTVWKRSRYYRRYPWKRQNARSRHDYDYDAAHFCEPSREDVFQLLVALHDVRQGNKRRVVNFCKRRRSAGTVFTNIRFLGRRK